MLCPVVDVMVATVLCDTLPSAEGADTLKFAIGINEVSFSVDVQRYAIGRSFDQLLLSSADQSKIYSLHDAPRTQIKWME